LVKGRLTVRIDETLHLVMSGAVGFDLTDPYDCNVFLVRAGDGWLMFDAGAGRDPDALDRVLSSDGIEPGSIRHLFLTHGHADHSGGAARIREAFGATIFAGAATAAMVAGGDEAAISLDRARRAGIYPPEYRYRACPVDRFLADGEAVEFGDVMVRLIATPGHSHDHVSYLVEADGGRRLLVAGDALFYGGKVAIQDIADCDVAAVCETVRKLSSLFFDALLPGHLNFGLRDGRRHAEAALAYVNRLQCPPSII
jgi:hydroxyacylglutathione hydrolase